MSAQCTFCSSDSLHTENRGIKISPIFIVRNSKMFFLFLLLVYVKSRELSVIDNNCFTVFQFQFLAEHKTFSRSINGGIVDVRMFFFLFCLLIDQNLHLFYIGHLKYCIENVHLFIACNSSISKWAKRLLCYATLFYVLCSKLDS